MDANPQLRRACVARVAAGDAYVRAQLDVMHAQEALRRTLGVLSVRTMEFTEALRRELQLVEALVPRLEAAAANHLAATRKRAAAAGVRDTATCKRGRA